MCNKLKSKTNSVTLSHVPVIIIKETSIEKRQLFKSSIVQVEELFYTINHNPGTTIYEITEEELLNKILSNFTVNF